MHDRAADATSGVDQSERQVLMVVLGGRGIEVRRDQSFLNAAK